MSLHNLNSRLFSPFDLNNNDLNSDIDNDPDIQFFCKYPQNLSNSEYYTEDTFNNLIKDNPTDNFSILHINIRSLPKNYCYASS